MSSLRSTISSPLGASLTLHILLGLCLLVLIYRPSTTSTKVEIEVLDFPKLASSPKTLQIEKPRPPQVQPPESRSVFGASRKAITTESESAAEIKAGNTVAKEQDDLKLEENDADSLPIPTDDYLVSRMPRLKSEIRIPYPTEAKSKGVDGPVVMDLLIDASGNVREVQLIRGPGFGLDEAALNAVRGFQFEPALVGEQAVAVKIRYTYRFVLENR